jgi:hypothetical protein
MVIVEHFPEFVLKTIQVTPETYECFANECVHLVAMNPEDKSLYYFKDGAFSSYWRIFTFKNFSFFLDYQFSVRVLIAALGLITAILSGLTARVKSSVKSQIAYASSAQIGIIFIELAAGFENLDLIHFASNAFLRTYQLLITPSVVSYLIKENSIISLHANIQLRILYLIV